MTYEPQIGDVADSAWRGQSVSLAAGNYLVEPAPSVSIGNSSTGIETIVSSGSVRFGNDFPGVEQQTLTHPDGPDPNTDPNPDPEEGPDPGATAARVDLITLDKNGNAQRIIGDPMKVTPAGRRFPRTKTPVPETPPIDQVVVAALWVLEGTSSSEEMYDDWVIPREVVGTGLNNLDLIPGRDLQYILDNAREGETLRGDQSQQIILPQPLVARTPGVTIDGLNLSYADGAATSTADDMLTIATDDVTVRNVTLDGNKAAQAADADGIAIKADARDNTVEDIDTTDVGGFAVNVNGGYDSSKAVTDTTVSGIEAANPGRGAVVVQGRAYRTDLDGINCDEPEASGGAVLVRNGPVGTTAEKLYCRRGSYTLKIADFGGAEDSAPVQSLDVDTLTADGTAQLLANDTSSGVSHREVHIENARLRNHQEATYPSDLIDLSNVDSASVTKSSLKNFSGGAGIRAKDANTLRVNGVTIDNGDPNESGILVMNGNAARITDNTVRTGADGFVVGIHIYARGEGPGMARGKVLGNDVYQSGGGGFSAAPIYLREKNGEIRNIIVKNNTGSVMDESTGSNVIVKDNI